MRNWHGYSGWWFVAMPLAMLGFWAVVAWAVLTVVRRGRTTPPVTASTEAERILAERYARSDIDTAEYHTRLDDLRRTGATSGDAR